MTLDMTDPMQLWEIQEKFEHAKSQTNATHVVIHTPEISGFRGNATVGNETSTRIAVTEPLPKNHSDFRKAVRSLILSSTAQSTSIRLVLDLSETFETSYLKSTGRKVQEDYSCHKPASEMA